METVKVKQEVNSSFKTADFVLLDTKLEESLVTRSVDGQKDLQGIFQIKSQHVTTSVSLAGFLSRACFILNVFSIKRNCIGTSKLKKKILEYSKCVFVLRRGGTHKT